MQKNIRHYWASRRPIRNPEWTDMFLPVCRRPPKRVGFVFLLLVVLFVSRWTGKTNSTNDGQGKTENSRLIDGSGGDDRFTRIPRSPWQRYVLGKLHSFFLTKTTLRSTNWAVFNHESSRFLYRFFYFFLFSLFIHFPPPSRLSFFLDASSFVKDKSRRERHSIERDLSS